MNIWWIRLLMRLRRYSIADSQVATPCIIAAPRYTQDFAHLLNRKVGAVSVDEWVPYFRSFVKMSRAFFRLHSPLAVLEFPVPDPVVLWHPPEISAPHKGGRLCSRKAFSGWNRHSAAEYSILNERRINIYVQSHLRDSNSKKLQRKLMC